MEGSYRCWNEGLRGKWKSELMSLPIGKKPVGCKCVFIIKYKVDN